MLRSHLPRFLDLKGIKVVRHSNRGEHIYHGSNDALFYYSKFIGGLPPGNIYLSVHKDYPQRSLRELILKMAQKGVLAPSKIRTTLSKALRGGV